MSIRMIMSWFLFNENIYDWIKKSTKRDKNFWETKRSLIAQNFHLRHFRNPCFFSQYLIIIFTIWNIRKFNEKRSMSINVSFFQHKLFISLLILWLKKIFPIFMKPEIFYLWIKCDSFSWIKIVFSKQRIIFDWKWNYHRKFDLQIFIK
jgi:hypothetical protein